MLIETVIFLLMDKENLPTFPPIKLNLSIRIATVEPLD